MTPNQWTRASGPYSDNCVEMRWTKSTASSDSFNCVEVARDPHCDKILVRDSKLGDASPVIEFTPAEWAKVLEDTVHDFPDRVLMGDLGVWWVGDGDTVLKFTWDEWRAFQDGAERGEFNPAHGQARAEWMAFVASESQPPREEATA